MYCHIFVGEGSDKTIDTLKNQIVQKSGLSSELVDLFFTNKTVNANYSDEIFISGNDYGYVVLRKEYDYLGNSLNLDEITVFDKLGVEITNPRIPTMLNAVSIIDGEVQEFFQFFVMELGYFENIYLPSATGNNKHMYYMVEDSKYAFVDSSTQVFALAN